MLVVDVGTNAEIVLGNQRQAARLLLADRPGLRGRADLVTASARRRARSSGCGSTRRRWSRASGSSAASSGRTIPPSPRRPQDRRHRHLRLGHHRGDGRDVPRRDHHAGRRGRRRQAGAHARASAPTGRTFAYRLHAASRDRRHAERHPRHPAGQGRALCRRATADGPSAASTPSTGSTLAGAFGSHIDPVYAMVLGMIPDCALDKVGSAGNAAGTGARIALLNRGPPRDRGGRRADREGRDRDRAALPGAFRRGDGDPAQDGGLSQSGGRGDTAGSQGGGGRRRGSPPPPDRLIERTCALSAHRAGTSQKGRLPSR